MKSLKEKLVQEGLIKRQAGMDMRAKIEAWLKEHGIDVYFINDDMTIDVNGHVYLARYKEKQLPDYIQFREVTQNFYFGSSENLKSLKGCPQKVGWSFACEFCPELESLEGCPKEVGGDFWCSGCQNLKSLKGCPQKVSRSFNCGNCGGKFTKDDVKKYCQVKENKIFV